MSTLLYDGTIDGLLTAVAEGADSADAEVDLCPSRDYQPALFEASCPVEADPSRVQRLLDEVRTRGSKRTVGRVLYAAMSERGDIGRALVGYVRQVRRLGAKADDFLTDASVGRVHEVARTVGRELHRLKGLVRFRELEDGTLWAPIDPEANIVAPLALYFKGRVPSEVWLIHDVRRRLAIRWDLNDLAWVERDALPPENPDLAENEEAYQTMWRTYFRTIGIKERRNPRLQRQNMPVRYWKHLIEIPTA